MKKKGRSSGKWEEPWWELLNLEEVQEKIPFNTHTKGATRRMECLLNSQEYESCVIMRESFPRLFPTSSNYYRAAFHIGDKIIKTILLKIRKNQVPPSCNSFIQITEIADKAIRIAQKRLVIEKNIRVVVDEFFKGTLTEGEMKGAVEGILNSIEENMREEMEAFYKEQFLPQNMTRANAKIRMRKHRAKKRDGKEIEKENSDMQNMQNISYLDDCSDLAEIANYFENKRNKGL